MENSNLIKDWAHCEWNFICECAIILLKADSLQKYNRLLEKRKDKRKMENTSVAEREKTVQYATDEGIRVRVSYPDEINNTIRQHKLNRMYDIFSGAMRRNSVEKIAE